MNIKIRKAGFTDIESMVTLLTALFSLETDFTADTARHRRGLEMMLEDEENRCVLVAEYQGGVIGMCSAQILISTAEGGRKALVEDVVVDEQYRGCGIGRQLLASLESWTGGKGVKRLDLMADRNNESGLIFYSNMNWNRTELVILQKKRCNSSFL